MGCRYPLWTCPSFDYSFTVPFSIRQRRKAGRSVCNPNTGVPVPLHLTNGYGSPNARTALSHISFRISGSLRFSQPSTLSTDSGKRDSECG